MFREDLSASPNHPSVLIVDDSAETREVLRTALAQRGVSTLEASEAREGLDLIRKCQPDVVVFDLETDAAQDEALCNELDLEVERQQSSLIVLGKVRRYHASLPEGQVVAKPYHYAPLIRTIERLCNKTARKSKAA